jgi:hypothetical protein
MPIGDRLFRREDDARRNPSQIEKVQFAAAKPPLCMSVKTARLHFETTRPSMTVSVSSRLVMGFCRARVRWPSVRGVHGSVFERAGFAGDAETAARPPPPPESGITSVKVPPTSMPMRIMTGQGQRSCGFPRSSGRLLWAGPASCACGSCNGSAPPQGKETTARNANGPRNRLAIARDDVFSSALDLTNAAGEGSPRTLRRIVCLTSGVPRMLQTAAHSMRLRAGRCDEESGSGDHRADRGISR